MANERLSTDNILEPYGGSINNDLINVMGNINEDEEINMMHMPLSRGAVSPVVGHSLVTRAARVRSRVQP